MSESKNEAMAAGRELDVRVATKIMELTILHPAWPCGYSPDCGYYEAALRVDDSGSWFNETGPIYKEYEPEGEDLADLGLSGRPVPFYSTSIADAWAIIEKLDADHVKIAVQNRIGKWACWLGSKCGTPDERTLMEYGETAQEAICLAALALVEGKQ